MNTLYSQLHTKVPALSAEHPYEQALVRYLLFALAVVVFAYLYLVSASVLNIIAQREADHRSASLEGAIGELEGRYFSLSQTITLAHASNLGLHPIVTRSYVYRLSTVGLYSAAHNAN